MSGGILGVGCGSCVWCIYLRIVRLCARQQVCGGRVLESTREGHTQDRDTECVWERHGISRHAH